jgi:hypothetical protein
VVPLGVCVDCLLRFGNELRSGGVQFAQILNSTPNEVDFYKPLLRAAWYLRYNERTVICANATIRAAATGKQR